MSKEDGVSDLSQYVENNAGQSFSDKPFNDTDALVFSQLSYINWEYAQEGYSRTAEHNEEIIHYDPNLTLRELYDRLPKDYLDSLHPNDRELLKQAVNSDRYGNAVLRYYEDVPAPATIERTAADPTSVRQFSAVVFQYEDDRGVNNHIAMRGTDGTIAGWYEDFNMAFDGCTEAQRESVSYVQEVMSKLPGNFELSGHSKGGNHAAYAYLFLDESLRNRINQVYTFDAPGFADGLHYETPDDQYIPLDPAAFEELRGKLTAIAPANSIIGQLMNEFNCVFVSSSLIPIASHSPYTWNLDPQSGVFFMQDQTIISKTVNEVLDTVLARMTREERLYFVHGLFQFFVIREYEEFEDFGEDVLGNLKDLFGSYYLGEAGGKAQGAFLIGVGLILFTSIDEYLKECLPYYEEIGLVVSEKLSELGIGSFSEFLLWVGETSIDGIKILMDMIISIPQAVESLVQMWQESDARAFFEDLGATVLCVLQQGISLVKGDIPQFAALSLNFTALIESLAQNWTGFRDEILNALHGAATTIEAVSKKLFETILPIRQELQKDFREAVISKVEDQYIRPAENIIGRLGSFFTMVGQHLAGSVNWCFNLAKGAVHSLGDLFSNYVAIDYVRLRNAVQLMEQCANDVSQLDIKLSNLVSRLNSQSMEDDPEAEERNFFRSIANYYNLNTASINVNQGEEIRKKAQAIRSIFEEYDAGENWILMQMS